MQKDAALWGPAVNRIISSLFTKTKLPKTPHPYWEKPTIAHRVKEVVKKPYVWGPLSGAALSVAASPGTSKVEPEQPTDNPAAIEFEQPKSKPQAIVPRTDPAVSARPTAETPPAKDKAQIESKQPESKSQAIVSKTDPVASAKPTAEAPPAKVKAPPAIPTLPPSNAPTMSGPDIRQQLEYYTTNYPTFYSDYDKFLTRPGFQQLAAALSNSQTQVTPEQLRAEILDQRINALTNINFMKPKDPKDLTAQDQLDPEATGRFLAATVSMQRSKDPVLQAVGKELRDARDPLQYAQEFMEQTKMTKEQQQEFFNKQNDALIKGLKTENGPGWMATLGSFISQEGQRVFVYDQLIEAAATGTKAAKEFINQQAGQSPDYMQMLKDYWPLILAPVGLLMTLFGSGSTRVLGLLAMGIGGVVGGTQVYNTYKTITSNPKMRDAIQLAVEQGQAFATNLPEVQDRFRNAFGEEAPQLLEAVKAFGMLTRVGFAEHLKNQVAHKALSEMEKSFGTPAQYWPGIAQKKLYDTFPQTKPQPEESPTQPAVGAPK